MLSVDKMNQQDFTFAVELANTMNWNMTQDDFAFNMQLEPNGCFVLKENSRLIGLATCLSYGKVGWFGNLIVDENHRKLGLGTTLLNHAIKYLSGIGVTTIGLYSYADLTNFYGNIGFKTDTEFIVMKTKEILCPKNSRAQTKSGTQNLQDISQIIALDTTCFGSSRAILLNKILSNKSNICRITKNHNKVNSFAIAKIYNGMTEVGPVVCQRTCTKNAASLIFNIMAELEGFEAYMYLPLNETSLIREVSNFGFKEEFKVVRMFLGSPVQNDCIYLAESLERG